MEATKQYQVKEINSRQRTFITKRATVTFDKLPAFFSEQYNTIYKALQQKQVVPTEPPCAIYYSINEIGKETDLAAAIPVPADTSDIIGFEKIIIPPSKVLTTTYYGSYDSMQPAYAQMENYLLEHNLQRELIIEEYFSDPRVVKDPAQWKTNIYFILK